MANGPLSLKASASAPGTDTQDPLSYQLGVKLAWLFEEFASEYRALWVKQLDDPQETLKSWHERFLQMGIIPAQIEFGYRKTWMDKRFETFPPKLREFIGLCRVTPEDLGLPSSEEAYLKACHPDLGQPHPAVTHAAVLVGQYELRCGQKPDAVKKEFIRVYEMVVQDIIRTGQMPEALPKALPKIPEPPASKAAAQQGISRLRGAIHCNAGTKE